MVERIKNIFSNHKTLIQNFSYLSALQVFNMLLPLITYPYLIRVLGKETYGLVVFAQAVISYFTILINFGFNVSATRYISVNRNDNLKKANAINAIYTIKFILFCFSFVVLYTITIIFPKIAEHKLLYILSYGICFNELLLPVWYFQGIEKMKFITIINLSTRSIFIIAIFSFVKNQVDYLLVPIFNSLGAIVGGLASIYIVRRNEKMRYTIPSLPDVLCHVKEAFPIFASGATRLAYMSTNKILIGSLIDYQTLTYFDLSDKILTSIKTFVNTIGQAIFPSISRNKNIKLVKRIMWSTVILIIITVITLSITSKQIIIFFTGEYEFHAQLILISFSISLIPFAISQFWSMLVLLPLGFFKEYSKIIMKSGIVYFLFIGVFLATNTINSFTIILTINIVELFILINSYIECKKKKLI